MIEALFAALFFSAGLMLTSDYVGMDDPQMLGHAIAIGGLWLVLREPRLPRDMVGAAALFALAFFVKHNLVVLPLAVAAWLALLDPAAGHDVHRKQHRVRACRARDVQATPSEAQPVRRHRLIAQL